ncbi:hypothetical protein F5Y13DRAFT_188732 [Hypoxylon sp. FL1857]|nr:hypothetical protein F5Y13DRAFT_188732 [Hypoxylon sp. FL1857]
MTDSTRLDRAANGPGLIFMACFFCLMIVSVVIARLYARRLTRAGFGVDDWLAIAALMSVLALNGIFIVGIARGAITGQSSDVEHLAYFKYAFLTTEKITFGLIKLSLLFLLKRIFGPSKRVVRHCWFMIGVISAWSVSFFFATVFECGIQWSWNWAPIDIFQAQCTKTLKMLTVFTTTDVLTDFVIMFMPVPLIWNLHISTKKKLGVTSIFMVGLFTIGAGIARMHIYLVISYGQEDSLAFIADFTLAILWSEIEANVAMVVCCMPTLVPVIGKLNNGLTSRLCPTRLGQWSILSAGRDVDEVPNFDVELSIASTTRGVTPWRGGERVVAEAGYSRVEEQLKWGYGERFKLPLPERSKGDTSSRLSGGGTSISLIAILYCYASNFTKGVPIIACWASNECAWYAVPTGSTGEEILVAFGPWLRGHFESLEADLLKLHPLEDLMAW